MQLNYHHLRHFRAIAHEGGLTRAAGRLNIAQSALSIQLRQLEETLGHALFVRERRRLVLTEAGRLTLRFADTIFRTGEEMVDTLQHGSLRSRQVLRIGAVATLSRNFQSEFLRPLRRRPDVELVLRSGNLRDLVIQLRDHAVDVVLSNRPVRRDADVSLHSHLLAEQEVSLVSQRAMARRPFRFPEDLQTVPVLLPSLESDVRSGFDLLLDRSGIRPIIAAEVDDMAMLRLLAVSTRAVAVVPKVVVQDELRSGVLVERFRLSSLRESFWAITASRTFPNPLVKELAARASRSA
ncbi:MAG: LysR family transcriptional regulator [Acidobacteriota bacterium]|nr:LysR family transcriptional regulator [Acidobacteriota bacterium]